MSSIRRAQLIAPFGVGALTTGADGIGIITASLDGWFDNAAERQLDLDEFRVREWRLEQALKVGEFRLPPDYRHHFGHGGPTKNLNLKVPFLRFPVWNVCPSCSTMQYVAPHEAGRRRCSACAARLAGEGKATKARHVNQVRFVAMCSKGHLQDFPWREWVHRSESPACDAPLRLMSTGGAGLSSEVVKCGCGRQRTLAGILEVSTAPDGSERTAITDHLADGGRYLCRGLRPWIDDRVGEDCDQPLRAVLRSATNLYFAHTESAIYLPGGAANLPDALVEALEQPPLSNHIAFLVSMKMLTVEMVRRNQNANLIEAYSDEEVQRCLEALYGAQLSTGTEGDQAGINVPPDEDGLQPDAIRRPEFEVLRLPLESKDLTVRPMQTALYGEPISTHFARVNLIEKLRETRVLCGFSRVDPNGDAGSVAGRRARLWQHEPPYDRSWLPAYVVRGEGLFIEFDEQRIATWEQRPDVRARVQRLSKLAERVRVSRVLAEESVVPRFVLLHTFAHILINQLVFDCGYSTAALRERVFCADGPSPMAAVMIYTAAGDSEGTMGGLVRMGRPGELENTISAALDRAMWCSADPVCMELGEHGQGPGGMNNAACHSCGLLPETACEFFNKFLDRALVAGSISEPGLGYFS